MKKFYALALTVFGISAIAQNTFPTTGNAGIGTSSPSTPFQIRTTLSQGATIFDFGNPQQYNQILFRDRNYASFLYGVEASQIKIGAPGNEHKLMSIQYNAQNITLWPTVAVNSPSNILINAGGNVGVGTTSPTYKLDVNGSLRNNGSYINTSWAGSGNRLLQVDASGSVTPFTMGNPGDILFGDGSWGTLPAAAKTFSLNGNALYISSSTSIGIGTSSPQYPLDVVGDARIGNNLYVGGGIVITDKVDATLEVKTGDLIVNNNLNVSGKSSFTGTLTSTKGIMFDNSGNRGISYTPPSATGPEIFNFGGSGLKPLGSLCNTPPAPTINQFANVLQLYDNGTSGYTGGNVLTMQSWLNGSSIDVAGGGGLLINYFCGKDVAICTGSNGGIVYLGEQVAMAKSCKIGYDGSNNIDMTSALKIHFDGPALMDGVKLFTGNNNVKAFSLNNWKFAKPTFEVLGNGQTFIGGVDRLDVNNANSDALLQVSGKIVAKEFYVIKPTSWFDKVFSFDYKLLPLSEVEAFYKTEKHLPDVPSEKEVMQKGFDLSNMDATLLRKIEELTLYAVDQQKQIEYLKKEVELLKRN